MKYILLIYFDEARLAEHMPACHTESIEHARALAAKGAYNSASPLEPVAHATSVRVRDGKPIVTDGPFAETREQLAGFYMVDVPDLDAAIAIAARIPPVHFGTVEIRPVVEFDIRTPT
jgi:hypothetical protein